MTVAVIYSTMSGHSRKLAEVIAKTVGVETQNLKECMEYPKADLTFLIGGIYAGALSPDMEGYIEHIEAEKMPKVAVVMSSVSGDYSKADPVGKLKARGVEVVGEHSCVGGFLVVKMFHPNQKELLATADFAKDTIIKLVDKTK